jgi:steroid 5-alpha reductase family enzyme
LAKTYTLFTSFVICIAVNVAAFAIAALFVCLTPGKINALYMALIADVIATVVVFGFSVIYNNSSLYDPYWSVAPPFIAAYWLCVLQAPSSVAAVFMSAILFWAIRLTLNWARGWHGLAHQDWRYTMLRNKNPGIWWLTNLGGIHMFPTIMVFLGMLPVYFGFKDAGGKQNMSLLFLGLAIAVIAAIIELIADEQMRAFKKSAQQGQYITTGLWKYTRHPNYFGEISFWFGLWLMQMAVAPNDWWTCIGFIAMLLMFRFASIPMMEERNLKNKPGYENYIKKISMLVPWVSKL